MRKLPFSAAMALGLGLCTAAAAQEQFPDVKPKRQSDIKFNLDVVHDTNLAGTSKAAASITGLEPKDETVRPLLDFNVIQPIGRQAIFLKGTAGYDFHRLNHQLDSENIDAQLGYLATVLSCRLVAFGGYQALQTDRSDLSGAVAKNIQTSPSGSVGADCRKKIGFGGMILGRYQVVNNTADLQKQSNAKTSSVNGSLDYASPSLGDVSIVGQYSHSDYPRRLVAPLTPPGDQVDIATLGASYANQFGSKLTVSLSGSETRLLRKNAPAGLPKHSNLPTYRGDVLYKLSSRLQLEALVDRSVVPSNRTGKLYDVDTNAEVIGRYDLGSKIRLTAGHRREDVKSNSDPATANLFVTKSRSIISYGSVRYRASKRAFIELKLRQEDRTTDLPIYSYSDTQLTLSTSVSF